MEEINAALSLVGSVSALYLVKHWYQQGVESITEDRKRMSRMRTLRLRQYLRQESPVEHYDFERD